MRWPSRSWIAAPSAFATVTWNGSFQRTAWLHWSRSVFPRDSQIAAERGNFARNSRSSSAWNFATFGDFDVDVCGMVARVYRVDRGRGRVAPDARSVIAAAGGRMAVRVARDDPLDLLSGGEQEAGPAVAVLLLVALEMRLVDAAVAALPELRVLGQ